MARDPDFDWIVEYETLPPEDHVNPDPPTSDRRRLPWWVWTTALLLIFGFVFLAYLWARGGEAEPLPDPEAGIRQLESIVQLEIEALQRRDRELYEQVQAQVIGRRNFDPPPDRWFSEENAGGTLELLNVLTLTEDAAQATVKIGWHGIEYRAEWFYRRAGDRWIHTDWATVDLGEQRELQTEHVNLVFRQAEQEQAEKLAAQVERIIEELCQVADCTGDSPKVRLAFDRYFSTYHALVTGPFDYRLPAPIRIRWP